MGTNRQREGSLRDYEDVLNFLDDYDADEAEDNFEVDVDDAEDYLENADEPAIIEAIETLPLDTFELLEP